MHKKKIILIRHGEAASTWDGDDRDPGLSKKGVDQAKSINDFTKSTFSKGYDFISSPKKRAIETLNYASEDIDVDSSGRILISRPLREYASLTKKIILIGQGDKFEIWDQNSWNENVDKWREEVTSNDDAEALSDISI